MKSRIKLLHLEDVRSDADIVKRHMSKSNLELDWLWVSAKEPYIDALENFRPDIVLSDHQLPSFNSEEAFQELTNAGLDIPFILVTATISEEFAVSMMLRGVADYLLKDRLQRLPVAVANALDKWESKKENRRHIEEIIRNEKKFRGLIENNHDLIALTDEQLNPIFASPSYSRITGWTLNERRKLGNEGLIHPDDIEAFDQVVLSAREQPAIYFSISYRMLHKNGGYLWLEGTVVNMLADPAIEALLFNLRNVTEEKAAEVLLRNSKANLRAVVENSSVLIYSIDRSYRYITFNTLHKETIKQAYNLDIQVGDQVFDFLEKLDPKELAWWEATYANAFNGHSLDFVKPYDNHGVMQYFRFYINPIKEGNDVIGLSCFVMDITGEKLAENRLAANEARFRALIENNFDAITLRNEHRQLVYASPSVGRMLGYTMQELLDINMVFHPDDMPIVNEIYTLIDKTPGKGYPLNVRMKHKQGHYIWCEGFVTNMIHHPAVRGIIANFRDVTERKEAELQQTKITRELLQRNKDLEQFAYIVSHNLRAPVANILGISNLLRFKEIADNEKQEALDGIFSATAKLDNVISDLNHILQTKEEVNDRKEVVHFEDLVHDIIQSIEGMMRKNNAVILTDFSRLEGISTVRSYIYSIFYNLISNSIKYKQYETDPVIRIESSRTESGGVKLTFADNGIGIDLTTQGQKVFGLYKRFHPNQAEGKGLGLFMVKTQVEALGGSIDIESEVNKGTTFTITI